MKNRNKPVNEPAGAGYGIGPHWRPVKERLGVAVPFDQDCLASILFGDTLPDRIDHILQDEGVHIELLKYVGLG